MQLSTSQNSTGNMPSRADVLSFIGFSAMLICGMVFHQQNVNEEHAKLNMDADRSVGNYDPGQYAQS
jgi:hypothetical protein